MRLSRLTAAMITGALAFSWMSTVQAKENNQAIEKSSTSKKHHKKIYRSIRKAAKGELRDYHALLTPKQEKTLGKMLLVLGNEKLTTIFKKRKSIKEKGNTLCRVHPFRFLEKSYSEDKYVAAMCSIVERSLIWSDFKKGLFDSLEEELKGGNLLQFTEEFLRNIGMEKELPTVTQLLKNQDWEGFIRVLNSKPRAGQPNRYDF